MRASNPSSYCAAGPPPTSRTVASTLSKKHAKVRLQMCRKRMTLENASLKCNDLTYTQCTGNIMMRVSNPSSSAATSVASPLSKDCAKERLQMHRKRMTLGNTSIHCNDLIQIPRTGNGVIHDGSEQPFFVLSGRLTNNFFNHRRIDPEQETCKSKVANVQKKNDSRKRFTKLQ